jgi:AraC-like DNA-binding protein
VKAAMRTSNGMFQSGYAGRPSGARYERWREEFGRRWVSLDFEPIAGDHVVAECSSSEHTFIGLCAMRGGPVRMHRRNDLINNSQSYFCFLHAFSAPLEVSQGGRSIELSPGQMTLTSSDAPACVAKLTEGQRWSIRIPRQALAETCPHIDDKIARLIHGNDELGKLLLNQMGTAHRFGPNVDAVTNHAIARHLLDLTALCLGAVGDAAELAKRRGLAAARLDAIKADILRRLGAFDIELATIAAAHRVSTRYVQHLFEQAGTSFTAFVLEQRLALAHRLLREPQSRSRKISDIATAAGFSDISYFNRAFRARYGATPKEIRCPT